MQINREDQHSILNSINLPNTKFMETLIRILEKYDKVLSEDDLETLTDKVKSRNLLKQEYPVLLMIDPGKKKMDQIHMSGNYRYYANKKCCIKGVEYFYTSQLYGYRDATSHGDNRTPLWKWVCEKLNINTDEDQRNEEWWPLLNEYNPGITKDKWIELLNNKTVFEGNSLDVMAAFHDIGGEASCLQLANMYGHTANYYNMTSIHLAEQIIKETGFMIPQNEEKLKLWQVIYVERNARKGEIGKYIWKLRPELFEALSEFGIQQYLKERGEDKLLPKETIEKINKYISTRGFSYEDNLISNFYLSIKSKPFVILAGTSGTGKTRLIRLFAEAVGATKENGRYLQVAVRPDWSDSSDLLGHVNLSGDFVPGKILEFIKQADENNEEPYFLCLDEMNLARVEYYMSDFLSVIETRDLNEDGEVRTDLLMNISDYGVDKEGINRERFGELGFPENLYIIGTVNMDETTFPFSKKVLDRANTIEFSYVDLVPQFDIEEHEASALSLPNSFFRTEYLNILQCDNEKVYVTELCEQLQDINDILKNTDAHVGYRVRDEVVFYMLNHKKADLLSENEALDNEMMQKILPRIQGSGLAVKSMLCKLFTDICAGDYDGMSGSSDSEQMKAYVEGHDCKYEKSAKKIVYMVRRFEEDGFTSYWL
jgi:MoxR-like ATPase